MTFGGENWDGLVKACLLYTSNFPGYDGFVGWSVFTIAYLVLWCLMKGLNMVATNSLNPMLADVIDYELYRSGVYCPGTIGSLFSLADKVISSLGPTIVAILCALIGFKDCLLYTSRCV